MVITRDVWRDMLTFSLQDEESGYIPMVPAVIAILVWTRRKAISEARISHNWLGTLLIGLGWAGWSLGYRYNRHVLWYGGADLMALGAAVTILGKDALFKFLPAAFALAFLVPVLNGRRHQISGPLELATAQVTQAICETLHMNVAREGNLLLVNGVEVAVAEACNGMRMVFTLVLVCYLYAFATPMRWQGRALVLALSPLIAMICNVTRLVPTAWVYGHASASAANQFHDISGWAMLAIGFLILMGIGRVVAAAENLRAESAS
jgi:exosortase